MSASPGMDTGWDSARRESWYSGFEDAEGTIRVVWAVEGDAVAVLGPWWDFGTRAGVAGWR